jgi:hypothetical protein
MRLSVVLCRAPRFLWYAYLLLCCVAANAFAQSKPLVTQYVECVQDDKGRDVASRSMQTPVVDSNQGFRAYGVVVASHSAEGTCKNTSTVYLAEPAGTFRAALQQTPELLPDGSVYDGNGIESIEWSPSGTRVLIQVSQWTWGTDSSWNTKYILLTPGEWSTKELPIPAAIQRYFAQPCAWLASAKEWLDEGTISIELLPVNELDEEGVPDSTPSCVATPTLFGFEVDSGNVLDWR